MSRSMALSVLYAVAAVMLFAAESRASIIIVGTITPPLPSTGRFYIPLQPSTSGTLGQPLGSGRAVGRQSVTVRLSGIGATSTGDVGFDVVFPVMASMDPAAADSMDPTTAKLILNFDDLDFKDQLLNRASLHEWMDFSYSGTVEGGSASLTMTGSNYGLYRPDGSGSTNNTVTTYTIGLMDDLGLTLADFAAIDAANQFTLHVTVHAQLDRTAKGRGGYRNTSENFQPSLEYSPAVVPEPATMAMFLASLPLLLKKRRAG